jgi:hypothetical protein
LRPFAFSFVWLRLAFFCFALYRLINYFFLHNFREKKEKNLARRRLSIGGLFYLRFRDEIVTSKIITSKMITSKMIRSKSLPSKKITSKMTKSKTKTSKTEK